MTNISLGQTIDGSLSSTDTKNPTRSGRFSDDYTLTGVSNWQQVQVNMDSTAIDSYLQLVNASTGEVIFDSDSNGLIPIIKNSQLKFTIFPGVNYVIRATSSNVNEIGKYTFKTSSLGTASSLVTGGGVVGTVDSAGRFVTIALGDNFNDIALSSDNKLFGIGSNSGLYSIDPGLGSSTLIRRIVGYGGIPPRGLAFSPSNILYTTGGSDLYTINQTTGALSFFANLESNFRGGDLLFDPVSNRFLATSLNSVNDSLFSISLNGESNKIGDIGFSPVFGLSFEGSTLVGFTGNNKRITINPETGKGTFDRDITGFSSGFNNNGIFGAESISSATLSPTVSTPTPTPTVPTPTPTPTVPTPTPTPTVPTPTPTVPTPTPTPTVSTPTPTPPTVVTPTPLTIPIPIEIGRLSKHQDLLNSVDSSNTSDFFRFSLTNRSSFNLLLDPQNAGKPSGDATVLLRSTNGQVLEGGIGIQIGKTSFISRELPADDYLIEVQRKPNASDDRIDYNLRTSAIGLTEAENQTLSLKSPSEIEGFVTNDVNQDSLIDKSPKLNDKEKDKERLAITISNRNGSPITSIDPNKETWIVVHGNADSSKLEKMSALADAVAEYKKKQNSNEEPQVLVVDWSQPADNNSNAGFRPDFAAQWVNKVAEFAVHSLKDIWGIPANKINLVGHSLGTFVSGLIAEKYLKYTNSKINKLILLDSARVLKLDKDTSSATIDRQLLDLEDYDLDGSQKGIQSPPKFSEVATFSRSIWGDVVDGNGLGSPRYNETANESIKVVFKGSQSITKSPNIFDSVDFDLAGVTKLLFGDGFTNHGDLVYLFSNILKGQDAISSKLSLDAPLNKEWRNIPGGPEAILQAEKPGNLDANKNDKGAKAATLIAKNSDSSGNDDDIVYGTNENDTLDGFSFNIPALGIKASRGSFLYSEAGNDIFYGEAGDDRIFGGSGNDTIDGGIGNDFINGQQDNDSIFGGDDNDTIFGAKGEDIIDGGKGNDSLEGNDGKDTLIGGENNDTLWGGGDDSPDSLVGGEGNDYIRGQKGNDTINGDQGNDFINGEQNDDSIEGGNGNDTIFGGKGKDIVKGGEGNDSLEGNNDQDTLIGGEGNDTLWGGGDNSADYLNGDGGNDSLIGEGGDDTLIGGQGKDTLTGGFGSDIFVFSPGELAASRDEADIITDFGTGFIGIGGADKIWLAGGLKADSIELETFGGIFGIGERTAIKANNGQYLAVLNSKFSKNDLNFLENFSII